MLYIKGLTMLIKDDIKDIESNTEIVEAMEELDLLTVEEVANMLRVKPLTIYRRLSEGKIEGWKVDGLWRIPRASVMRYLKTSTVIHNIKPKLK